MILSPPHDDIEIRLSRAEDMEPLLNFIEEMGFTPRSAETWLGLSMSAIVAWQASRIVGAIPLESRQLVIAPGSSLKVVNQTAVAVRPEFQGKGLGTRLQEALNSNPIFDHAAMTVYREGEDSAAYRWYRQNQFYDMQAIRSLTLQPPYATSTGESYTIHTPEELSSAVPEMSRLFQNRVAGCGGYVSREDRPLQQWLSVHPYRSRYRYRILTVGEHGCLRGYAVLGIGRLHSTTERVDLLEFIPDVQDSRSFYSLLNAVINYVRNGGYQPIRMALSTQDSLYQLFIEAGFLDEWGFKLMVCVNNPQNLVSQMMILPESLERRKLIMWTPRFGEVVVTPGSGTPVRFILHEQELFRLLLHRLDLTHEVGMGHVVMVNGNGRILEKMAKIFSPVRWIYHSIEYC